MLDGHTTSIDLSFCEALAFTTALSCPSSVWNVPQKRARGASQQGRLGSKRTIGNAPLSGRSTATWDLPKADIACGVAERQPIISAYMFESHSVRHFSP